MRPIPSASAMMMVAPERDVPGNAIAANCAIPIAIAIVHVTPSPL